MIHAGGNIPIDGAHFITGLILTHFFEIHPLPFENAMVLAGESFANEPVGANFDLADFFKNFARNHGRSILSTPWNHYVSLRLSTFVNRHLITAPAAHQKSFE